jgi:uncharacterized membrane protein
VRCTDGGRGNEPFAMMNKTKSGFVRTALLPLLTLVFVSLAGAMLVALRIAWTGHFAYLFLIWNLILAWLPLVFAVCLCREYDKQGSGSRWKLGFLAGLWLLFLPNAPYIFTDLVHLNNWFRGHYWVDLSLILLFALTGFMVGFLSLYLVQEVVADKFGRAISWLLVAAAAGLSGFGIYVGRFLRWNSWAVVTNPMGLTRDLGHLALHPLTNYLGVVFPALFATFLFLAYLMLYALTQLQPVREHRG